VAKLDYTCKLPASTYTIQASFAGDDYYVSAQDTATLTQTKATPTLTAADTTCIYKETTTLSATLTHKGEGISEKEITFTIKTKEKEISVGTARTDKNGVAKVEYTCKLPAGKYTIQASFAGDAYYEPSTATATLVQKRAKSILTSEDGVCRKGEEVTLSATLFDKDKKPIVGKSLKFKVRDWTSEAKTDKEGKASVLFHCTLSHGTYRWEVAFEGDEYYEGSSASAILRVVYAKRKIGPKKAWELEHKEEGRKVIVKGGMDTVKEHSTIVITKPDIPLPSPPEGYGQLLHDLVYDIHFIEGGIKEGRGVELLIEYDEDILAGVDEDALQLFRLKDEEWIKVPFTLDKEQNTIKATLSTLSIFRILLRVVPEHLGDVVVYPNPFKPYEGHTEITFGHPTDIEKRLTAQATIKIYSIAGELVATLKEPEDDGEADGVLKWDATNDAGKPLAPGVYIYYITNPAGEKCIGKIAIIR
jgi:5-hydroxyisourate hydrolase-like protein (transthyretin family)